VRDSKETIPLIDFECRQRCSDYVSGYPCQGIRMAALDRNYELKKNHTSNFSFICLNTIKFASSRKSFSFL